MRSKLVLAALVALITSPVFAQVAPAVKIGGLPLSVGVGLADYSIDYQSNDRMLGVTAWADYSLFHGLGVEVEGQSIFADRPSQLCNYISYGICQMKQDSIKGGAIYKARPIFHGIHPYAKFLVGIGEIYFPAHELYYTQDSFLTYGMGGGIEYKVWRNLSVRGDYEYQYYRQYLGNGSLNPNGVTVGVAYYLRGVHRHY